MSKNRVKILSEAICFEIGYYADRNAYEWLKHFYGCTFDVHHMIDYGAMSVGAAVGDQIEFLKFLDDEDCICPDFILDHFGGRRNPSQFIAEGRLHNPYKKLVTISTKISKRIRNFLNKMADRFESIIYSSIVEDFGEDAKFPCVQFEGREMLVLEGERWYRRYSGWHYID